MSLPLHIRPATIEEVGAIAEQWLTKYRESTFARELTTTVYFDNQKPLVHRLLRDPGAAVATHPEVPGEFLGWMCAERLPDERFAIHFAVTKKHFRSKGIARRLAESLGMRQGERVWATHVTYVYRKYRGLRVKYGLTNDPYILRAR